MKEIRRKRLSKKFFGSIVNSALLLRFIGLIVPRRLRADWRQEWEAELRWREGQLVEWDKLDARN